MAEEELKARISFDTNNYIMGIKQIINQNKDFQNSIKQSREVMESVAKARWEAKIKADNREVIKKTSELKEHIKQLQETKPIKIAAQDMAKDKLRSIKHTLGDMTGRPHRVILKAIDQTKKVINTIKDSIFNLKTLAAGIVFGATTKKGFDWTLGAAMKNEDYLAVLQNSLKDKKKGQDALEWSYKAAEVTPFNSNEVVEAVTGLATVKMDYKKALVPLGDLAAGSNKPVMQAIHAMQKLKSGQYGIGLDMFRDLNLTSDMLKAQGAKFDKQGSLQVKSPEEATQLVLKTIKANFGGLMDAKSKTASGRISNIGDSVEAIGRSIAGVSKDGAIEPGGMFAEFKKQLQAINPIIENFQKSKGFAELKKQINSLVASGGTKFTKFLEDLGKNPEKIDKAFSNAKKSIKEFAENLKLIKDVAKGVFNALKPILKFSAKNPKTAMGIFAGLKFGPGLFKNILKAPKNIKKLKKDFSDLKTALGFLKKIKLGNLKSAGRVFSSIGKGASQTIPKIKLFGSIVGNVLGKKAVKDFLKLKNGASKAFLGCVKGAKRFFTIMMANPVVAIIAGIILACVLLYEAWKHNWGGIREKTKAVVDFIKQKIPSIHDVYEGVKTELNTFVEDMKATWQRLREFFAHPIKAIVQFSKEGSPLAEKYNNDPSKKNALGTSYFSGGLTWLNEGNRGEIVDLPSGSRIYPHDVSKKMASSGSNITIDKLADTLIVREDADIDKIADALVRKIKKTSFNMA